MANYIKQYITLDEFNTLQKHGLQYTGFITGVGYTYSSTFAIAPAHMQIQRESPFVKPGLDKYILGRAQYLDASPEAIARSYNVKPDDIAKKIITTNPQQGTIKVNMGNQNYVTLPIDNSNIKIDVNDDGVEQIVNINVIDTITNKPSSAKYKMVDVPTVFGSGFNSFGDRIGKVNEDASSGGGSLGGSFVDGFVGGAEATWGFVKSQFTWEGYSESLLNTFTLGAYGGTKTLMGAANLAINIPNYTANDYAYGAGFAAEKGLELLILRKMSGEFQSISGGFRMPRFDLRFQSHTHSLNPISGRGVSGSSPISHFNINKFHIIYNPKNWSGWSNNPYLPYRYKK